MVRSYILWPAVFAFLAPLLWAVSGICALPCGAASGSTAARDNLSSIIGLGAHKNIIKTAYAVTSATTVAASLNDEWLDKYRALQWVLV